MGLEPGIGVDAELQRRAADIAEFAAADRVRVCSADEIEPRRSQMRKTAVTNFKMLCIRNLERGGGATDPGLVLEAFFLGCARGFELIGVEEEHPCLQWYMSLFGWAEPGRVREFDALPPDMRYRAVDGTLQDHQLRQRRCTDGGGVHVFAFSRPVI